MKLKEISISGFKNLGKTSINFSNNQVTSLIALNNYGKSNFLESLEFSYDFIHASQKQKKRMMEYYPAIPINKYIDTVNFEFSVLVEATYNKKPVLIFYEFEFIWTKGKNSRGAKIISENLKIKEHRSNSKFTTLVKRDKTNTLYQSSPTARCNTELKINKHTLAINKLINYDDLFYNPVLEKLFQLDFTITNLMEVEPAYGAIQIGGNIPKSEENQLRDGHNISKFLFNLKKNKIELYELLVNSLKDLIPTIEKIDPIELDLKKLNKESDLTDIPFTLPEKFYDIRIKERNNNQTTSISYVSRGTKRILLILATAIDASQKKNTLLAFEELENSIHPSLLQKLLIILTGIVPNVNILVTSHSPYLIQYLPISSIYLGVPNNKGLSCFYRIKNSKQNMIMRLAADEESNLGDYLFDMMIQDSIDPEFQENFFELCSCI